MARDNGNNVKPTSLKMMAIINMCAEGRLYGELDCEYFDEPFVFSGLVRMIEMMETTFDIKGYPENYLLPRSFKKARQRMERHEIDLHEQMEDKKAAQINNEPICKTCNLEILVRFRQNAEWQGQIYWAEQDSTKEFSSIVEMSRVIDEALAG